MLLPWPEFLCPGRAVLGCVDSLSGGNGRGWEGGGGSAEEAEPELGHLLPGHLAGGDGKRSGGFQRSHLSTLRRGKQHFSDLLPKQPPPRMFCQGPCERVFQSEMEAWPGARRAAVFCRELQAGVAREHIALHVTARARQILRVNNIDCARRQPGGNVSQREGPKETPGPGREGTSEASRAAVSRPGVSGLPDAKAGQRWRGNDVSMARANAASDVKIIRRAWSRARVCVLSRSPWTEVLRGRFLGIGSKPGTQGTSPTTLRSRPTRRSLSEP